MDQELHQELHQLILQAKKGNEEAFAQLVTRFKGHVFRHAYAMVNDKMEAEDIAQEAFLKAYISLSKLENEYAFVSWLTRIVANLCYDRLKKLQKEMQYQTEKEEQELFVSGSSNIERSQVRLTIQEALQTLSVEHKAAIVLRDIQGYSYDEIAEILHIPVGTVKSRISTARAALRRELSRGEEYA
ncbi:RNA polymerase sigma factor [Ectobacillus panaciterrae]|uniref:RNA polymerase sigma factor n=1 Tax=Ectobacillus panaciterrae TaxID=363872 RepID=UPI0004091121|nr:RNA polymerase sigma factor [Ectobacillus panaciterrae]